MKRLFSSSTHSEKLSEVIFDEERAELHGVL
jgi:hypothetical protein